MDKKWEDVLPSFRQKLGSRIADAIREIGGADAAAVIAEKSVKQLGRYVSGDTEPSLEVLARLSSAAGWEIEDMFASDISARNPPFSGGSTDPLDLALMEMVVSTVADRLGQHRIQLKPDRLGQLCAAVYRIVDRERRLNPAAAGHFDRDAASSVVDAVSSLIA